jgi:hypothetical protein
MEIQLKTRGTRCILPPPSQIQQLQDAAYLEGVSMTYYFIIFRIISYKLSGGCVWRSRYSTTDWRVGGSSFVAKHFIPALFSHFSVNFQRPVGKITFGNLSARVLAPLNIPKNYFEIYLLFGV